MCQVIKFCITLSLVTCSLLEISQICKLAFHFSFHFSTLSPSFTLVLSPFSLDFPLLNHPPSPLPSMPTLSLFYSIRIRLSVIYSVFKGFSFCQFFLTLGLLWSLACQNVMKSYVYPLCVFISKHLLASCSEHLMTYFH